MSFNLFSLWRPFIAGPSTICGGHCGSKRGSASRSASWNDKENVLWRKCLTLIEVYMDFSLKFGGVVFYFALFVLSREWTYWFHKPTKCIFALYVSIYTFCHPTGGIPQEIHQKERNTGLARRPWSSFNRRIYSGILRCSLFVLDQKLSTTDYCYFRFWIRMIRVLSW